MKSTELRIGNWVSHKDVIQFVESINDTDSGVAVCCLSEHDNGCVNIEPIPLTEEWLIKFGFEKFDENFYCLDNMSLWEGSLNYNINDKFITMSEGMGNSELMLCKPLEHVHSLQNLYFALTGEELTIKE